MTILSCQKRHHEPHYVRVRIRTDRFGPVFIEQMCNGLPQWTHARPKPPRISSDEYADYQREHGTISVAQYGRPTIGWCIDQYDDCTHRTTLTKAIQYAQNLVNERKKNSEPATRA